MKMTTVSIVLFCGAMMFANVPHAVAFQGRNNAQEKAANLRSQLADVETKQLALQTRLAKLEEDLKSESIEHSLAGVGSTRPEDLRDQRRRQLEIERNGVRAQLDLLATSHSRIEASIAQADADAYRQSATPATAAIAAPTGVSTANPSAEGSPDMASPAPPRRTRKKRVKKSRRSHHPSFRERPQ